MKLAAAGFISDVANWRCVEGKYIEAPCVGEFAFDKLLFMKQFSIL